MAKFADSVGLPTEEGLFGFKPFPEVAYQHASVATNRIKFVLCSAFDQYVAIQVWVGRLAMMGFLTSMIEEVITKKGTLGQIGFVTPSPPLFVTISGAATVATFVALVVTFYEASTGKMTAR